MSEVWKYFYKLGDNKLVKCKMCNTKLKYSASTSVMWNHLKNKHATKTTSIAPEILPDVEQPEQQSTSQQR